MDGIGMRATLARGAGLAREQSTVLAAFAGTLFLSALLLFSVQPMFAKMVLPKLGGSPSVWAVSMCFFQAVLLAGYCYAHALNRLVSPTVAPIVHLTILAVAFLALPVGLPAGASEPPAGDAYVWLIGLLCLGVGLPFFAVSANAPLLQAWFARTGHPHAKDPYFLYGASNLGSLAALLAYPIIIEPMVGLSGQAQLWTQGFFLLGLLIAASGVVMAIRISPSTVAAVQSPTAEQPAARVTTGQRFSWIALAFVPSGLLVAFTSFVTTDIASAPFLWVIPLAIFLATFILVFREKPLSWYRLLLVSQPMLVAAVLFGMGQSGNTGWVIGSLAGLAAFFVTTMVCHKELYDRRPGAAHLTEFYLWMSLGGVLGGIFAALIAPQIFNAIYEFPLLLVLGMACRPGVWTSTPSDAERRELVIIAAGALAFMCLVAILVGTGVMPRNMLSRLGITIVFGALTVLAADRPLRQLVFTTLIALGLVLLPSAMNRGNSERSFFGTHRVTETFDGKVRLLLHGTTVHGAQRITDKDGKPVTAALPATYYYPDSPMARGVVAARANKAPDAGALRVGIVGLGAGSMACHARAGEAWRFYEIDPVVVKIAKDTRRFDFLARCQPQADIVLGDARLTVAKEPAGGFDYLVIDAFSSDSVPVHLLTTEALKLYADKLSPNGLLALHVSNRHLDLVSVAAATVTAVPGLVGLLADDKEPQVGFDEASSHVVLIAKNEVALQQVRTWRDVTALPASRVKPWTDDYSDILTPFWRRYVK